jgi:LPXTG-motif cell wall-anchored protein
MHGKVVVQAASAGSPDDSGSTGGSGDGSSDDGDTGVLAGDDTSSDAGSGLPATGFEALLIALLGVATLAAGLLLRRRSEV